jgi:hypothetical protein
MTDTETADFFDSFQGLHQSRSATPHRTAPQTVKVALSAVFGNFQEPFQTALLR